MTGLLNPKLSEIAHFFGVGFIVYLDHKIFHPVPVSFSPNQFWGWIVSPQIEESQKKRVDLYRSTRLAHYLRLILADRGMLALRTPTDMSTSSPSIVDHTSKLTYDKIFL